MRKPGLVATAPLFTVWLTDLPINSLPVVLSVVLPVVLPVVASVVVPVVASVVEDVIASVVDVSVAVPVGSPVVEDDPDVVGALVVLVEVASVPLLPELDSVPVVVTESSPHP